MKGAGIPGIIEDHTDKGIGKDGEPWAMIDGGYYEEQSIRRWIDV